MTVYARVVFRVLAAAVGLPFWRVWALWVNTSDRQMFIPNPERTLRSMCMLCMNLMSWKDDALAHLVAGFFAAGSLRRMSWADWASGSNSSRVRCWQTAASPACRSNSTGAG